MTFIYNNLSIILMSLPILVMVVAFLIVIIKLPKMCLMAIPYRPPIPPDKFKRKIPPMHEGGGYYNYR